MNAPYREHARTRTVLHGRFRLSAPLLGLFALTLLCTLMFSIETHTKVTVSCRRLADEHIECVSTGARTFNLVEPIEIRYEPQKVVVVTAKGSDTLVDGDYSDDELRQLGAALERVRTRRLGHDEASAGRVALQKRIVVPGALASALFLLLAFRRRRVVIDRDAEKIHAATMLGVIPIGRRHATIAREQEAKLENSDGVRRVVIENRHGRIALFEGRDRDVEELAERVNRAL